MKDLSKNLWCFILLILWPIISTGCLKHVSLPSGNSRPSGIERHGPSSTSSVFPSGAPSSGGASSGASSVLLLAQAQFRTEKGADGKDLSVPGAAKLTLVTKTPNGWESSLLEDPESNVFHKAMWFSPAPGAGGPGILTIGGNAARLKLWHREAGKWKGTTLWGPTFGGEQNRLRDIEVGDVTGDGVEDLVVATHDQGVVGVLQWKNGAWDVTELNRTADTFVHEIKIGDVNGDGRQEFFATPSEPNRLDGTPQPGKIIMYRFDGERFAVSTVEEFPDRHVKEILVADVSGSGHPDLFSAVEGEMAMVQGQPTLLDSVKIKQYRWFGADKASGGESGGEAKGEAEGEVSGDGDGVAGDTVSGGKVSRGRFLGKVIADLPDMLCRNLTVGDVDGDGSIDIVASTMRSGVWILRQKPQGDKQHGDKQHRDKQHREREEAKWDEANWEKTKWEKTLIDAQSSSFEHATLIADLNHDGKNEIYVASDDQHFLRRYQWDGKTFHRDNLVPLQPDDLTFGLTSCPPFP
jgi:hypothetical protein